MGSTLISKLVKGVLDGSIDRNLLTIEQLKIIMSALRLTKSICLQKAINPGSLHIFGGNKTTPEEEKPKENVLDYSKINVIPPRNTKHDSTINYAEMNKPSNQKPAWSRTQNPVDSKEAWIRMNRASRERNIAQEKSGIKPSSSVTKPSIAPIKAPKEETKKNEMLGYPDSTADTASNIAPTNLTMSEKEPHLEDPKHEEKEKKKAKKIKKEAQSLIDMHSKS